jgi:outer membrane receptor protein involved in Fe transport
VFSSDYSKKISKQVDLTAGIKYSTYRFTNDVAVTRFTQNQWITDNDFTAKYFLKEDIPAAYTSVSIAVDEKNSIKAGLRYEYTISNLGTAYVKNIVDRKYGKLFPSLFISHKINDNNSINFSYSKRITRPTFRDLAPFVYFVDPNTFLSGNSALQPSTSNSASIAYSYKRFLFSVSYSDEKNFIAGFQSRVDAATNKQYLIAENYPDMKTVGVTISLPFTVSKWWNMQNNFSAQWQRVDALYNNQPLRFEQEYFNFVSTQTFQLPKDYSFELQGFYASRQLAGTYVIEALGALNAGIQKKLRGQKGKLSFNVRDILNSLTFKANVNLPAQNLVTNGSLRFSNRTYALTYSKNFGSNTIKANRNKSAAAEEERRRVE